MGLHDIYAKLTWRTNACQDNSIMKNFAADYKDNDGFMTAKG